MLRKPVADVFLGDAMVDSATWNGVEIHEAWTKSVG